MKNIFSGLKKFKIMRDEEIKKMVEDAANDANAILLEKLRGFDEFDTYFRAVNGDFTDRETIFNQTIFKNLKKVSSEIKNILLSSFDSPFSADLGFEELNLIQNAIWNKYVTDPIIQGAVENYVDYVIGSGVNVSTPVEEVNIVFRQFEKQNRWFLRQKEIVKNHFIDGEYFTLLFNNLQGDVFVRKCHPSSIESMETAETDYEVLFDIYRRLAKFDQFGNTTYSDQKQYIKTLDYDMYQKIGIGYNKSKFEGQFIKNCVVDHMKFNDSDKLRGLPPLKRILKWSKLYENFIMDRMVLNHERAKVVWIKTYTQRSREALMDKPYKSPSQGTMLIEKDGIQYRTEKPNLDSSEAKEDGLGLLYYIATSVRFPLHILNQRTDQQVYASACLQSTNFLTNNGWKNLDDIDKDEDLAATINPITHLLEWQPINGMTKYWYEGDMYSFENKSTCALVTPNHDMYLAKRGSSKHNKVLKDEVSISNFKKIEAEKAFNIYSWWSLCKIDWPEITPILNTDAKIPSFMEPNLEDWLKILGFYIGDGSINFRGYVVGDNIDESVHGTIRIHSVRQRKIDYLLPIAKRLNWDISYNVDGDVYFSYSDKEVAHWLKNNAGHGSYNKQLPLFVFNLPTKLLNYVFEGLLNSDGSIDSRIDRTIMTYSTRSLQLAEDVMMITLKLGYRSKIIYQDMPEIRKIKGRLIEDGERRYHIKFFPSDKYELMSKQRECIKLITGFKGYVGCINVDNGLIVTRRNGKIAIHGNSIRKADTPFQKMIESAQYYYSYYFERIYRHLIEQKVLKNKLKPEYNYPSYSEEALLTAIKQINDGIIEGKSVENITLAAKKILDDGKEIVKTKTVDIPISQDFQQILLQDPKEMAEVLKIHKEIGIASLSTLSAKGGYIWKKEFPKIMSEFQTNLEQKMKETGVMTPQEPKESKKLTSKDKEK